MYFKLTDGKGHINRNIEDNVDKVWFYQIDSCFVWIGQNAFHGHVLIPIFAGKCLLRIHCRSFELSHLLDYSQ